MSVQTNSILPRSGLRPCSGPFARVAVVGAGIAGLAAAWSLSRSPGISVALLEREPRFGGHAHTEIGRAHV